jgi:hypothetical protein
MKTFLYNTTKLYLVNQKANPDLSGMKQIVLSGQADNITGNC